MRAAGKAGSVAAMSAWLWLGIGLVLIFLESVVPGLVISFFGVGALLVAGAVGAGWVQTPVTAMALWVGATLGLTLGLRPLLLRWMPPDRRRRSIDEGLAAYGTEVEVLETIRADAPPGRIRFQGTTWPASCVEGEIPAGSTARLIMKDGIGWVVEPTYRTPLTAASARVAQRQREEER